MLDKVDDFEVVPVALCGGFQPGDAENGVGLFLPVDGMADVASELGCCVAFDFGFTEVRREGAAGGEEGCESED